MGIPIHDDVIKWKRFPRYWPLCGNSPVTGEFPSHTPLTRSLIFSLICAWINGWVNSLEAGDLRRHRAHYGVTVVWCLYWNRIQISYRSYIFGVASPLQWRHNGHDDVSNHQHHHRLLSRLFGRRSKKTSKLRVAGLCAGNSPGTGEFPAQMASNAENVSIWWRHHERNIYCKHAVSNTQYVRSVELRNT